MCEKVFISDSIEDRLVLL